MSAELTPRDREIVVELEKRNIEDYYLTLLALKEGREQPQREPKSIAWKFAEAEELMAQLLEEGDQG